MKFFVSALMVLVLFIIVPVMAVAQGKIEPFEAWTERLSEAGPFQQMSIHGAIEAEAGYSSDYDNNKESDIDLTSVELGIDVELNDWLSGFFLMKWEDDESRVFVDEGGIILGNVEIYGASLTAGKLYVPFGVYETNLISDPLTLELGETREGAAVIDVAAGGFYGSLYTFNSAVNKINKDDDMIDAFGATVGYAMETEAVAFDLSAGWISNLTSSGGFSGYLDDNGLEVDDHTNGVAVSAVVAVADFSLIAEYVAALDSKYEKGNNDKPSAWGLELGYDFELLERDANVAVSYQGTDEAVFLGLPDNRISAGVSYALHENLALALEASRAKDYSVAKGGSGKNAEAVIATLTLEF